MLMVIFGAGASYDSNPSIRPGPAREEDRPPLANELFDDRAAFASALSKFPRCSPIIPFLRGTQAVEQELERLQNDANEPPPFAGRLRQLAAVRWYFQSMLTACGRAWYGQSRGITNYLTLIDQILRWGHEDDEFPYYRSIEASEWMRAGTGLN